MYKTLYLLLVIGCLYSPLLSAQQSRLQLSVAFPIPDSSSYHLVFLSGKYGQTIGEPQLLPPLYCDTLTIEGAWDGNQRIDLNIIQVDTAYSIKTRKQVEIIEKCYGLTIADVRDQQFISYPTIIQYHYKRGIDSEEKPRIITVINKLAKLPDLEIINFSAATERIERINEHTINFYLKERYLTSDWAQYLTFGENKKSPAYLFLLQPGVTFHDTLNFSDFDQITPLKVNVKNLPLRKLASFGVQLFDRKYQTWRSIPQSQLHKKNSRTVLLPSSSTLDSFKLTYWYGSGSYNLEQPLERFWLYTNTIPQELRDYPFEFKYQWLEDHTFWISADYTKNQLFEIHCALSEEPRGPMLQSWRLIGHLKEGELNVAIPKIPQRFLERFPTLALAEQPKSAIFSFHHLPDLVHADYLKSPTKYHNLYMQMPDFQEHRSSRNLYIDSIIYPKN